MAGIGGSIESVAIKGRLFAVAADADTTRKLGGFENEIQANGNGSGREIKTRMTWMLGGLQVEIDEDRGDHSFLQGIADTPGFVACSITYASGAVYQGSGTIVDALEFSSQSATATLSLGGTGQLTLQ
jgi:hypothetical protein